MKGPPTLEEEQKHLDEELKLSRNLVTDIDEELLVSKRQFLQHLLFKVTSRIKQLWSIIKEQEKVTACCLKMKEKNLDYDLKYSSLSSAEELILDCKLTVKKCLQLNREIYLCSAALGGCRQFCPEGYQGKMSSQSNYKELMPPENIEHLLQYKENSVWVKQKSELWEQLRQYSVITGSTCSNTIGLTTLSDQKKHFDTFVLDKKEEISEELQQRFDHGVEFEKRAVATLVGLLLPALFPICHKLFEVGPVYADSEFRECMLEVSADGILKCDMGGEKCPHGCSTGCETYSLEIKSPVSDNIYYENKYFIPKHNYPQVLCQQFVHTAFKGLFVTCTQESVILNSIDENIDLWNNLATVIFDTYGHEALKKPTELHPEIPALRKNLDHCSHENVVTLGEVPTYSCSDTDFTDAVSEDYHSPYVLKLSVRPEISDVSEIIQQLKIISIESQNIFSKCSDLG